MNQTAKKLNRAGQSHSGTLRMPYSLSRCTVKKNGKERRLSATQLFTTSAIYSFGAGKKNAEFTCKELAERYRISKSSAYRAVHVAIDNNLIERKDKISEYHFEGEVGTDGYLHIEEWALHAKFEIEGRERFLTFNEVRILFHVISQCANRKGAALWLTTNGIIARRLGLSPTTVENSLERLKAAKLLYVSGKALNSYTSRTISVNNEAVQKAKDEVVRRAKSEAEAIKEANAKADRDRYYAHMKAAAEERAEHMNARARADEAYREATDESRKLDVEIAKAEVYRLPTLAELIARKKEAEKRRAERLAAMNLTEQDLIPVYHCKKCSDTGYLPNGTACDCYERGRR